MLAHRANTLVDADGRPLGEVSSPGYADVPTEVVACPYADRRHGSPMNRSALRQLSGCWDGLLATVRALVGPEPTVHRAWWACMAGMAAPLAVDGPVPVPLAALYKTSLGLSQVTASLLLTDDGVADAPLAALGDAASFGRFVDEGGWLLGQVQVCAGPMSLIEQMYTALSTGSSEAPPDWAPLGDVAVEVVGLQAAYVCAAYRLARAGGSLTGTPAADWLRTNPPWLRAVLAAPNRPPEHARRLFEHRRVPASVDRFLDAPEAQDGEALYARFSAEIP